ncbi:MAG: fructosamine kinase family protein [Sumerlaeia bacterium]
MTASRDKLYAAVEALIAEETGERSRIASSGSVGGGCINAAQVVTLEDGRRYFLKSNADPLPELFAREADGLRALAAPGAIRVPRVIGHGGGEGGAPPFLLTEAILSGPQPKGFMHEFGAQLARLHQATRQDRCGFDHDNYIGSTPQPNGWMDDWVAFWAERRLGFQLDLTEKNHRSSPEMRRLGQSLLHRLPDLIGEPVEPACLLHGDLWGGNYLCSDRGEPVLIDPAAYYGRREADLAMTLLFGGFTNAFYGGYESVWPLAPGSKTRLEIYKLYHLLNHLNIFGGGYMGGCLEILRRYGG